MSPISGVMTSCYKGCLRNARMVQVAVVAVCVFAFWHVDDFTFDASADTLVDQGDPELAYYEEMTERFGRSPFIVLTYSPQASGLFEPGMLATLDVLQQRLSDVDGVAEVTSLLDAPLLRSPPIPLTRLADGYLTLRDPEADLERARAELTSSPLFANLLVSEDGGTTALRIALEPDAELAEAEDALDAARAGVDGAPTLSAAEDRYREAKEAHKGDRARLIEDVRRIRDDYLDDATLFLGGVPMVAADIIEFVKRDMTVFGIGVVLLISLSLFLFFGRLRWVFIPLGTVSVTTLILIGLLGFLERPVTAISANFVALIAIITISFTIHLIARYRELCITGFSEDHVELVYEAMRSKLAPCIYTGLTTAVAFGSLMTSDIAPVVQFGWIMCVGIGVAFLVTYSFFAGVLVLIP
jgi:predicted RND superfamily exporter protein